jgi:8-oxo-dGTP pyrophosphatase MutT (NUDIX family)
MAQAAKVAGDKQIVFQGKILEVVQQPMEVGSGKIVHFEWARRAPGTRLIIISQDKKQVLLTKEYRYETKAYDYRLPGGKVFDSLAEYNSFLESGADIIEPATVKAKAEAREEAGIEAVNLTFFYKGVCGATVEWDLYYFVVGDWTPAAQATEDGEDISVNWVNVNEAQDMALDGRMQEDRSAIVLLRYLNQL